jgi:hypothetical protein
MIRVSKLNPIRSTTSWRGICSPSPAILNQPDNTVQLHQSVTQIWYLAAETHWNYKTKSFGWKTLHTLDGKEGYLPARSTKQ